MTRLKATCGYWFGEEKELSKKIANLIEATDRIAKLTKEQQGNEELIKLNLDLLKTKEREVATLKKSLELLYEKAKPLSSATEELDKESDEETPQLGEVTQQLGEVTQKIQKNRSALTATTLEDDMNSWNPTFQTTKPQKRSSQEVPLNTQRIKIQRSGKKLETQKNKLQIIEKNLKETDLANQAIQGISERNKKLSHRNAEIEDLIEKAQKGCPETAQDLKKIGQNILGAIRRVID